MIITSNDIDRSITHSNARRKNIGQGVHCSSLPATQPTPEMVGDYSQDITYSCKDKKMLGKKWNANS